MVILPVAHDEEGRRGLLTVGELEDRGDLGTAKWFRAAGSAWERHRTERSRNMDFNQRLNFQNDLSRCDFMSRFVVIYNRSGTNAVATVLETENFPLPFVANHAFYWAAFSDKNEALYLCAYLNSSLPNKLMKPFQTQGLFGARDICKKSLRFPSLLTIPITPCIRKSRISRGLQVKKSKPGWPAVILMATATIWSQGNSDVSATRYGRISLRKWGRLTKG